MDTKAVARELRELRERVEFLASQNVALSGLVVSLVRHQDRLGAILRVWDEQDRVAEWMRQPDNDRWRDLVGAQADALRDACDRPL